jgi:hypothetical protein
MHQIEGHRSACFGLHDIAGPFNRAGGRNFDISPDRTGGYQLGLFVERM